MLFGLLFGLMTSAFADDAEYNDLLYETRALLKQKQCDDAEGPSRDLVSDYPERAEAFLMRGLVMSCQKEDPEKIYRILKEYLRLGGDKSKVSSTLSALEKKLFTLDIIIDFKSDDPSLSVSELELNLNPVVIPGRNRVDSLELRPDGNRYRVEGLVPGRYSLEIESDTRLIQSTEERIEGTAGKTIKKRITLSSVFDEFEEAIKQKNCVGAEKLFNKNNSYLQKEVARQWELDSKICRALRDKKVELWLDAWEFASEKPALMTAKQKEIFTKNMGSPSFSVRDQYGNKISSATLTVQIGNKSFPAEIVDGFVQMMGLPFQEISVLVDAGKQYEPFQKKLQLKRSSQNISLQLERKPFTILTLPDYDTQLALTLIGIDNDPIALTPASDIEVLLGSYKLLVEHQGASQQQQLDIKSAQKTIDLPWGYSIVDEKGNVLYADISFSQKILPVQELAQLELPEKPDVRFEGDISPSAAGTTQVFDIDLGGHPAIEAYHNQGKAERSLKQAKSKAVVAGTVATVATITAGFFQLQSMAAASLAREVDDPEDMDKYDSYVSLTRSKQNLAYGGYATMGLTYTWLGLNLTKAGLEQKRLREAKKEYETALKEPIIIGEIQQ